jgi:4-amino-4-deoxy-L-arabinose transferase-like glycosyltransferase
MFKLINKYFFYISFFLILVLGFLIRIWDLDKNPAGFFCDEASIGYNAYSILKTGKDEHGNKFPILFKAFGEYKRPTYIYSSIPFVRIFGLNEFAVRLTSAFYGTLTVLVMYLMVKQLFDKEIAFYSSLFMAISPWHIHFSRIGFEAISFIFWTVLLMYILFKSFKNFLYYYLAVVVYFIAFFTYYPAPIYLFFILFFLILFFRNQFNLWSKKNFFWITNFLILLFFIFICQNIFQNFIIRWNMVKMNDLNLRSIIHSYLNHFSIDFLFTKGDIDFPGQFITRHSIRGIGQLYLFQLPFLVFGLLSFFLLKKERKYLLFFLMLLIVYPFGSIFTVINPQATRSIFGVIPFQVITAVGIVTILKLIKKKLLKTIFLLIIIIIISISFLNFLMLYKKYPLYSSDFWGWQYGPKEIIRYFITQHNNYDELYMSGEFNCDTIFFKFYDPNNLCRNKCKIGDLWRTPQIYDSTKKQLFSLTPDYLNKSNFKERFKIKKIIYYPNGSKAFYIGEVF